MRTKYHPSIDFETTKNAKAVEVPDLSLFAKEVTLPCIQLDT